MGRKRENQIEEAQEKYISLEDAMELLEADEPAIQGFIRDGKLHGYRIGDQYLRFRKDQVSELKAVRRIQGDLFPKEVRIRPDVKGPVRSPAAVKSGLFERVIDLWYFCDFYVVSLFVIVALLYLILSSK